MRLRRQHDFGSAILRYSLARFLETATEAHQIPDKIGISDANAQVDWRDDKQIKCRDAF